MNYCPHCGSLLVFTQVLIQQVIDKDQMAIDQVYEMTSDNVYYSIKTMVKNEDVVMDLMQDTYVAAFYNVSQLKEPAAFRGWIKRIAHNKTVDYLRKTKPMTFSQMVSVDSEEVLDFKDERTSSLPEAVMDQKETSRLISQILDTLSEEQRVVVGMFYFDNLSIREIASVLGISENTVKSRLNYARKKIEAEVKNLEKKGTKLYSMAPIPFMLWLFKSQQAYAAEIPAGVILGGAGGAATGAAGVAAGTVAKAGARTLLTKVAAGIMAAAVMGTGAVIFVDRQQDAAPSSVESTIEPHYIKDPREIRAEEMALFIADAEEQYLQFLAGDATVDIKDGMQEFTFWREHIGSITETAVWDTGYYASEIEDRGYEENLLFIPCTITLKDVRHTDRYGNEVIESFEDCICVFKLRNLYRNADGSLTYDESYIVQSCFYETKDLLEEMELVSLESAYDILEISLKK